LADLPTPGKGCIWDTGWTIQKVNFRSRPNKKASKIATLPAGTGFDWLEDCPGRGYVRAVYKGKIGWVYNTEVAYVVDQGKPVIYLYPEKETKVSVRLGEPDKLTHSYPEYPKSGWKVVAQPDGTLLDAQTGRNYYGLYWEGINPTSFKDDIGFVVKGADTAKFLEEKLAILGLNWREANEFIVYWLPKMEDSAYNLINFSTEAERNQEMSMEITPKPDSVIRVFMEFKKLDQPIKVKEQVLHSPKREGFTVVEWGGTER